jgi:aspartate-semialdehyde dehydrogenase
MRAKPPFAVLVGSESLLGREIRDLVATCEPGFELRLIAADGEEAGRWTRVGDEAVTVGDLDAGHLSGAGVAILAGPAASSRRALELAEDEGTGIVDLTFAAEERPDARVRAPLLESPGEQRHEDSRVHVIAHPAAMALALLLRRLHAHHPLRRAVVQIFAPASEQGKPGVEELQRQTISLFSFKPLPREVFDAQLSFTMLARYGEGAPAALEDTELRIERHLATLLEMPGEGRGAPLASLRVIQAPVFHGYTFGIWAEFEDSPDAGAVEASLAAGHIEVRSGEFPPPTNVGQAGQGGIAVGAIAPDRNHGDALWLWMAADNYRLAAESAIAVARQLL